MTTNSSLEDSVCFVCWHGIGLSVFCKDYFEDYLKSKGVRNVKVYSAGVQWFEQRYADRIKNTDLLVITLPEISESEVREKFDFNGRIYRLEEDRIILVENKEEFEKPSENSQTPHKSALNTDVKKGHSNPSKDKKWQSKVYSALVEG
ncbi:MAG: hypothetical protein AABX39_02185 [Nanoarchaeota archaeon]